MQTSLAAKMCGIYISFFILMLIRARNTTKLLSFKIV